METFVVYIRDLIKDYRNLKVLTFKNWKWNNTTISIFSIYNNNNLEKVELINNKLSVDKFWCIFNPDITTLKSCTIENWVMSKITGKFNDKLIWNSGEKNYST